MSDRSIGGVSAVDGASDKWNLDITENSLMIQFLPFFYKVVDVHFLAKRFQSTTGIQECNHP
jgi:hypothetical protein